MLLKLNEIKNLKDPLKELVDKEIPVKTAYKFLKLVKAVEQEVIDIEQMRIKMVKNYGEIKEDGKIIVTEENQKKFLKEYEDFMKTEVDLDIPDICIDDLGDINISVNSLSNLEVILNK